MRAHPTLLPFAATFLAVGLLSLMDALMKGAALAAGAYSAALLRSAIAAAIVIPLWLAGGGRWPARPVLRVHLRRGVVAAFMALTFFYALTKLPIAETIAISFVAPLAALWLAAFVLGEQIRREAIAAAVLGLIGTLVIIGGRIGNASFDHDTLLGLLAILFSAALYAYNLVLTRQQALLAGPLEVATFHSGVGVVTLAAAAPFLLTIPDAATLRLIGASSFLTIGGSMAFAWAYARAEAQALVPIEYSGFLWAALFGWLFFSETVTTTTLAGTVLIVIGCWLATRRARADPPEQLAV